MKTKKSIIILICAVILLGGIYLFISHDGNKTENQPEKEKTVSTQRNGIPVFETEVGTITSVKIQNEESFEIYLKDNEWYIRDYEDILFNRSKLNSTVLDYVKVIPSLTIEDTSENKAVYGLDKPSASASVSTSDGKNVTFYVGNATKGGNGYYFMLSGDDHIYTISNVVAENMKKTRNSYRDTELFDVSTDDIIEINMNVHGVGEVSVKRLEEQSDVMTSWLMTKPFELGVYDEKFSEYVLTPITSVDISGFVSDHPTEEQLLKSGISDSENYYEVKTAESSYKIIIGDNYDGNYIVKRDDLPSVYLVPAESFSFLSADIFDYLNSYSYLPLREDIEKIKISFDDGEYELRQENYSDEDNGKFFVNDISVDNDVYTEGYKGIIGIKIDGRAKNVPEIPDNPEFSYTVFKNDGTEENISYVRMNGMYMYQYINGKCEFYVKAADVDNAKDGILSALNSAENPEKSEDEAENEKTEKEKKTTNNAAYVIVFLIICLIAVFPVSMLIGSNKKK